MNMQQMMTPALLAGIHIDDKTIFGKYLRHRRFTVAFYQDYNLRAWVMSRWTQIDETIVIPAYAGIQRGNVMLFTGFPPARE